MHIHPNHDIASNTQALILGHASQRRMRADVAELAAEARALKRRLRQRWLAPMAAVQQRHAEVKLAITYRMIVLAALRGRFHVRVMPRLGSIPGTDQYYFRAPGASLYSLLRWDPGAHRDRVVRALVPMYDATPPGAQVSP